MIEVLSPGSKIILEWWKNDLVCEFNRAIKTLTGLIFFVLGLCILNYGTRLETAVSQSTSEQPQQRGTINRNYNSSFTH